MFANSYFFYSRAPLSAFIRELISNNDGDSFEKVTQKVNWRCLKLIALIPSRLIRKIFLELNSKGLFRKRSSAKREIRHFHVVVVQRRLKMYKKA